MLKYLSRFLISEKSWMNYKQRYHLSLDLNRLFTLNFIIFVWNITRYRFLFLSMLISYFAFIIFTFAFSILYGLASWGFWKVLWKRNHLFELHRPRCHQRRTEKVVFTATCSFMLTWSLKLQFWWISIHFFFFIFFRFFFKLLFPCANLIFNVK